MLHAAFHRRRGAAGGGMTSRMGSRDVSRLVRVDRCGARRLSNVLQWSCSTIKVPSNEHAASLKLSGSSMRITLPPRGYETQYQ